MSDLIERLERFKKHEAAIHKPNNAERIGEAIAHIQSLEQRNRELEEENRWIPIEERLPDDESVMPKIFFTLRDGSIKVGSYNDVQKEFAYVERGCMYSFRGCITHWKPVNHPFDKNIISDCGCRFENDESNTVELCEECSKLPCHNGGKLNNQEN